MEYDKGKNMLNRSDKISLRQMLFIFVNMAGSPSIRFIPVFASEAAGQAAWLCPLVSLGLILLFLFPLQKLFNSYRNASLVDILQDILGKVAGKAVCIVLFIWIAICVAFNMRYFAERIVTTIFPNSDIIFFLLVMSLLVGLTLRSGIVVLARMNEIFLPVIVFIYAISNLLLIPEIRVSNLTPITYLDIIPVMTGSIGIMAVWAYFPFIFLFSDLVNNKEKLKKEGTNSMLFLTLLTTLVLLIPIGLFSSPVVNKMPIPFYEAIKEISTLNELAGIETAVISIWILTDYVLLFALSFAALHIPKTLLKSPDNKPFINTFFIAVFFISLLICSHVYELEAFSKYIAVPANIALSFGLFLVTFIVGKIRKKF
ncbi:MAG: GerAB/ArcD/ProY family transporter [Bacillota bacterium]